MFPWSGKTCIYCSRPFTMWSWLFNRDKPQLAHMACPVEPEVGK